MRIPALLVPCAALLMSCTNNSDLGSKETAIHVTQEYIKNVINMDQKLLKPNIDDLGDKWKVTYTPELGSTGSPMKFTVSKQTGKIVDSQ